MKFLPSFRIRSLGLGYYIFDILSYKISMVDCLSWYNCYGNLRYSKEKRSLSKIPKQLQNSIIKKSNIGCGNNDVQLKKKQYNINNNNNNTSSDEQNILLHFYVFDVSRERNLHLATNSYDKRLLGFYNISNGLYKIGLRNGDILIYLNETNLLKPPVALTIDRVKSEFTALRREKKSIEIGICRCSDRSLFNNTTIKHLGSLTFKEFKNLSQNSQSIENPKSSAILHRDSKKLLNLFSNKKKPLVISKQNSIQDNESIENEKKDKYQNKKSSENQICSYQQNQNLTTQIYTDACFIYRREIIPRPPSNAVIIRGREIAYEAANSPTIPSSMPNYTHDQIRELYGELDKKTRRLQENEYILHTPIIDAWKTNSSSLNQCPLPKFHIENNDQTIVMTAYLSTGLSNKPSEIINNKDIIRGSFRTTIDDRTEINPSPMLFNLNFNFNKLLPISINKQQSQIENLIPPLADYSEFNDLDQQTTEQSFIEINPLVTQNNYNCQILPSSVLSDKSSEQIQTLNSIDVNEKQLKENDIDDDFEELYERYMINLDQYEKIIEQLEIFEQKQDFLTPITEENPDIKENIFDDFCLTLTVKRQLNHIGHYGFEYEQTLDGKIQISSIINSDYCQYLNIGDEILNINNYSTIKTIEQCHLLFHSLWYKQYDCIQLTVKKQNEISNSEPVSLQSSSLSWPLSITESGKIIAVFFLLIPILSTYRP